MRGNDRDALRELDWSKVYAPVPGAVDDGVRVAFLRIRQRGLHRRRALKWAVCAACLVLCAGAALMFRSESRAPDRVVPLAPEAVRLDADSVVYASRADACFHVKPDCERIEGEIVALKLVTAREFEKALCPACGANVLMDGH